MTRHSFKFLSCCVILFLCIVHQSWGQESLYYADGKLKGQGKILNGKRDGEWSFFLTNGNLALNGKYVNGKRTGVWIESVPVDERFDFDRSKYDFGIILSLVLDANHYTSDTTGKLLSADSSLYYQNGMLSYSFSAYAMPVKRKSFITGQGVYVNDAKSGEWVYKTQSGRTILILNYDNGLLQGNATELPAERSDGRDTVVAGRYDRNLRTGLWQLWLPDEYHRLYYQHNEYLIDSSYYYDAYKLDQDGDEKFPVSYNEHRLIHEIQFYKDKKSDGKREVYEYYESDRVHRVQTLNIKSYSCSNYTGDILTGLYQVIFYDSASGKPTTMINGNYTNGRESGVKTVVKNGRLRERYEYTGVNCSVQEFDNDSHLVRTAIYRQATLGNSVLIEERKYSDGKLMEFGFCSYLGDTIYTSNENKVPWSFRIGGYQSTTDFLFTRIVYKPNGLRATETVYAHTQEGRTNPEPAIMVVTYNEMGDVEKISRFNLDGTPMK